jgi:hypothetical protein
MDVLLHSLKVRANSRVEMTGISIIPIEAFVRTLTLALGLHEGKPSSLCTRINIRKSCILLKESSYLQQGSKGLDPLIFRIEK